MRPDFRPDPSGGVSPAVVARPLPYPATSISAGLAEVLARYSMAEGEAEGVGFQVADGFIRCEYDARLYRPGSVGSFLDRLEVLLANAARHAGAPLEDLPILTEKEEQRLLVEWNETASDYPRGASVHSLLEQAALRFPKSVAAQFQARTITYRDLNSCADAMAGALTKLGARAGTIVGISLDRSLDMLTAVYAVLKTGAAFLPLDPAFPPERLRFMAADADIRVLVTSRSHGGKIETPAARFFVDESPAAADSGIREGAPAAASDSPAYVLYTSGSTGKPKGVSVSHRSVVNLLTSMQGHVGLKAGESLLAVTTLSFDIAMLELFLPALTGARTSIASRAQAADPRALAALIQRTKPALMQATPVTWRLLVETGWTGAPNLKILIGGERVSRPIADALLDRSAAVWNVYGPTETTIWSTICRLERNGLPISIGRPLANTVLYVLDSRLRPAPVGAPGELYIGGDGVALGYLNRPELTAERFVRNPFGDGRLFRTGDLVRYLPDGGLEILGRNDAQVKVRGFRIELGDVENALAACAGVAAAAVAAHEGEDGETFVAGYFSPRAGIAPDLGRIRAELVERLPAYMVPAFLLPVSEFPLTPNGKIDRKALPKPTAAPPAPVAAATAGGAKDLTAMLTAIWESALGVHPIGPSDNFFDLGGHSVTAARMFAQLERALGKSMPLASLFQAPTIAELAALIQRSDWRPMWSSLVPIRPGGTKPPFFFVHPIGGNVLNFSGFSSHFGSDQPIYGLQARGLDLDAAPHTTVEEMAEAYIRNIREVQRDGPYYIGGFSAGGVVAFEMARQLQAIAQPVGILALLDTELLTPPEGGARKASALHWLRVIRANIRYASQMSAREFVDKKLFNFRMRRKLFAWSMRERLGRPIDPSVLNAEEAFLLALKRYEPKPYYGDATLFRAGDGGGYLDPELGWSGIILGRLDIREVSGNHDTILQEPHIGMLARLLEGCLGRPGVSDSRQGAVRGQEPAAERMKLPPVLERAHD